MPRATSNVSMRSERPIKDLRRRAVDEGENDDDNRTPGASGNASAGRSRRPGRAATLPSTSTRARSTQRRRAGAKTHATTPRDNPSKSSRGAGNTRGRKA